jgi:hypothetical protein
VVLTNRTDGRAADATLEKRFDDRQNWRADISDIVTDAGEMVECPVRGS